MARGVNKVILIGNLGNDPDVRVTATTTFANMNIATDESYKDKQTGQMVPKTEWHKVVFSGKVAEICQLYLKKGSKVFIEGRLQTRKWQDQNGNDRYTTEIRGFEMQMLDGKGGNQQQAPQRAPAQQGAYQQQAPQQQSGYQQQAPQQQGGYQQQAPSSPMSQNNTHYAEDQNQNYASNKNRSSSQAPQMEPADDFDSDIPF